MSEVLAIFAKAPRPGWVKTRLVPPLTFEQAAAVHEASLHDVIALATATVPDTRLFYDDVQHAREYFSAAFPRLPLAVQRPGDLGLRLADAFQRIFEQGAERVAIIGADSPTLPGHLIADGLAGVRSHDIALGPTADGGYYLIAIRQAAWPASRTIFEGIPWSTEQVLETTMSRAEAAGISSLSLNPWYDIDHIDDLRLAETHAREESHLGRLLRRSGWGEL